MLRFKGVTALYFIGDSGYPLKKYLLTPIPTRNFTEGELSYNRAHKKTRVVIERAFGELKARWRCINKQGTVNSSLNKSHNYSYKLTNKLLS